MIPAARTLVFLSNIVFYAAQAIALLAGLNAWFGWQGTWVLVISLVALWMVPIASATGIVGILGAHYGWQWSWLTSISLFVGIRLLVTAIQVTILNQSGSELLKRFSSYAGPSGRDHSNTAPTASGLLRAVSGAMFCVALIVLGGLLITQVARSVASQQPSDIAAAMPAQLDPQFKISLEKFSERLNSTPEFVALLRTMTPQEAMLKTVELRRQGLLTLSVPDLERLARFNLLLLNSADLVTCARIAHPKGEVTQHVAASTYALLVQQPPAVIDDWLDLSYRAILASLQKQPGHRPSQQEIDASLRRVLATLPEAQQYAIRLLVESPARATDEQLCAGLKALTSATVAAPAPDRAVLVRSLALR
ncbi:hypothetical protein [Achromobacter aegrifaciens]|jgi:hypothetical protein|nr:hypothetical protein [Achromobacter aegrifaciens]